MKNQVDLEQRVNLGSRLVSLCLHGSCVNPVVVEALEALSSQENWVDGRAWFNRIREEHLLEAAEQPVSAFVLAELVAKICSNASSESAPFDLDSFEKLFCEISMYANQVNQDLWPVLNDAVVPVLLQRKNEEV